MAIRKQSCKAIVLFPSWFRFLLLIVFLAEKAHAQIYILPNIGKNFKAAFFNIGNLSFETNCQKFTGFFFSSTIKIDHYEDHITQVEFLTAV